MSLRRVTCPVTAANLRHRSRHVGDYDSRRRSRLLSLLLLGQRDSLRRQILPLVDGTTIVNDSLPSLGTSRRASLRHDASSLLPFIRSRRTSAIVSWNNGFSSGINYTVKLFTSSRSTQRMRAVGDNPVVPVPESHRDNNSIAVRMQRLVHNSIDGNVKDMTLKEKQEELLRILEEWLQSSFRNTTTTTRADERMHNHQRSPTPTPDEMHIFCTQQLPFSPHVAVFGYLIDAIVMEVKNIPKKKLLRIQPSYAEMGERILHTMLQHIHQLPRAEDAIFDVFQPSLLFHKVMRLYCMERKIGHAERLLWELEGLSHERPGAFVATRDAYTIVLSSYARRCKPREAEHILLSSMLQRRDILPTRENFESCLNAWAVSGTRNSGQRAELLLLQMQDLYEKRGMAEFQPTVRTVSKATAAWVNSNHPEAMARAESVLSTMYAVQAESMNEEGVSKTLADTHVLVSKLWSCSKKPEAPEKCRECLELLRDKVGFDAVSPHTVQKLYAALIFSWAQSKRSDIQSQVRSILVELRGTDPPVGVAGNAAPNLSLPLYHALFHAYAKTGDFSSADRLLEAMIEDHVQRGSVCPESHVVTNHIPPPKPDVKSFNCVLIAWRRSGRPDAADECLKLLLYMDKSEEKMLLRKDIITYNTVLATLASTNSATMAYTGHSRFLELIESDFLEPTHVTFLAAFGLWVNVRTVAAVQRMEELVALLKKSKVKPDARMYDACMRTIKKSPLVGRAKQEKLEALRSAIGDAKPTRKERRMRRSAGDFR